MQSESIDKLTTAFIAACLEIEGFEGDKNGNYGKYVTINEIKRAAYKICLRHGVRYVQGTIVVDGNIMLCTKLSHSSGQWEMFHIPLQMPSVSKRDVNQDIGSSLSYQRRYALYGLFGILGEDLDPDSCIEEQPQEPKINLINYEQLTELTSLLVGKEDDKKKVLQICKVDALNHISHSKAIDAIKWLKSK